jgi:hypothetical protein
LQTPCPAGLTTCEIPWAGVLGHHEIIFLIHITFIANLGTINNIRASRNISPVLAESFQSITLGIRINSHHLSGLVKEQRIALNLKEKKRRVADATHAGMNDERKEKKVPHRTAR